LILSFVCGLCENEGLVIVESFVLRAKCFETRPEL
jgi:hypothetical protein